MDFGRVRQSRVRRAADLPGGRIGAAAAILVLLAASVFHDGIYSIAQVKAAMAAAGVPVRLTGPDVSDDREDV